MRKLLGSEGSQPQLYVVGEPDGLGSRLGSFFARPDGSRQVAEVVSHLERNHNIGVVFFLRDHSDEETDLVGLPEGDDTEEKRQREVRPTPCSEWILYVSPDLLWVILEVLRFSQFIVFSSSIFARQKQLLGGNNYLGTNEILSVKKNSTASKQQKQSVANVT